MGANLHLLAGPLKNPHKTLQLARKIFDVTQHGGRGKRTPGTFKIKATSALKSAEDISLFIPSFLLLPRLLGNLWIENILYKF